nr:MAG TPA: hypothetical protein [Caudoviricetes sp.]DAK86576.1 MAG TPA: hypothetical protein [Caudoviricetes sp.]
MIPALSKSAKALQSVPMEVSFLVQERGYRPIPPDTNKS